MEWTEIGLSSLRAAKALRPNQPRSCVSRAYYAAHAVLTGALVGVGGYLPTGARQTPPHHAQAQLIGAHLGSGGTGFVRELRKVIRRLYARRLDADYRCTVSVDSQMATEALRDASTVFRILGVMDS